MAKDKSLIVACYDSEIIEKELAEMRNSGYQLFIDVYVFDGSDGMVMSARAQNITYLCAHICPSNSSIQIIDTNTSKRRNGIGSFALKTIDQVIKNINAKLDFCKYTMASIGKIKGMLAPGGEITEEQLKEYYVKNGFEVVGGSIIRKV